MAALEKTYESTTASIFSATSTMTPGTSNTLQECADHLCQKRGCDECGGDGFKPLLEFDMDTLKKEMEVVLDVPMPTDPREFSARTEKERDSLTRTLEQEISLLDGRVERRTEYPFERWPVATLPAFVEPPPLTLRADLEAMRNAASFENERLVLQEFKSAVQAAVGNTKIELQERATQLLGDKMLEELSKGLEASGTKVYDDHFNGIKWYFEMEHYTPHRAVVAEEVRQNMRRFSSKNAAAIKEFLEQKVRALLETYEEAKWQQVESFLAERARSRDESGASEKREHAYLAIMTLTNSS